MKYSNKLFAFALAAVLVFSLAGSAFAETLQIGIPDDGTNLSRGIKLLETAGLITVDPAAGYTPEIADITGYLYDVDVVPVQANTLPSTLAHPRSTAPIPSLTACSRPRASSVKSRAKVATTRISMSS